MKRYWFDYFYLLAVAGIIVALDQWTKTLVRMNLAPGETWTLKRWLHPYFHILNWKNTGAAFGFFQNGNLVFTILAFVVIALILYYFPRISRSDWSLRLALCLQMGGAAGNLIDRLSQGYVTDFIRIGNFPIFNIADMSISSGVVVLLVGLWLQDRRKEKAILSPGDTLSDDISISTMKQDRLDD